jgi:hypothetical protein
MLYGTKEIKRQEKTAAGDFSSSALIGDRLG